MSLCLLQLMEPNWLPNYWEIRGKIGEKFISFNRNFTSRKIYLLLSKTPTFLSLLTALFQNLFANYDWMGMHLSISINNLFLLSATPCSDTSAIFNSNYNLMALI